MDLIRAIHNIPRQSGLDAEVLRYIEIEKCFLQFAQQIGDQRGARCIAARIQYIKSQQ